VGAIFPATGETLYKNMAWVGTLVSSALFVFALFIPRSPRWLTNRGQVDSARKTLVFLRGANYDVEEEIEEMKASQARADAEGKASLSELFSGATLKAMGVMTGLMLFQQLSGINSVIFFSGKIFAIAGLTNATLASVILGVVQVRAALHPVLLRALPPRPPLTHHTHSLTMTYVALRLVQCCVKRRSGVLPLHTGHLLCDVCWFGCIKHFAALLCRCEVDVTSTSSPHTHTRTYPIWLDFDPRPPLPTHALTYPYVPPFFCVCFRW
jgi:hypothetical protein